MAIPKKQCQVGVRIDSLLKKKMDALLEQRHNGERPWSAFIAQKCEEEIARVEAYWVSQGQDAAAIWASVGVEVTR